MAHGGEVWARSPVSAMPITGRCLEEGIEQSGIRVLVCFPHFLIARITLNQSLKIG